jgi:hypothetical protein
VAGALTAGIMVATRRSRTMQIAALAILAALLLVLTFSVPTLVSGNL